MKKYLIFLLVLLLSCSSAVTVSKKQNYNTNPEKDAFFDAYYEFITKHTKLDHLIYDIRDIVYSKKTVNDLKNTNIIINLSYDGKWVKDVYALTLNGTLDDDKLEMIIENLYYQELLKKEEERKREEENELRQLKEKVFEFDSENVSFKNLEEIISKSYYNIMTGTEHFKIFHKIAEMDLVYVGCNDSSGTLFFSRNIFLKPHEESFFVFDYVKNKKHIYHVNIHIKVNWRVWHSFRYDCLKSLIKGNKYKIKFRIEPSMFSSYFINPHTGISYICPFTFSLYYRDGMDLIYLDGSSWKPLKNCFKFE